jgi:hypothetical protein
VAWHLVEAGYTVELDVWDWATGQNFVARMSDALDRANRVMTLFSAAYFERPRYTTNEWAASMQHVPSAAEERLIPLRVEDVPAERIPAVLRQTVSRSIWAFRRRKRRGSAFLTELRDLLRRIDRIEDLALRRYVADTGSMRPDPSRTPARVPARSESKMLE